MCRNGGQECLTLVLTHLRGSGGLHQNSLEIDFIVVSDGGGNMYQMLLVPWKNINPSRNDCPYV